MMHAAAASRRSLWAGLDALVLEEIEGLRKTPPPPRRPPPALVAGFASDEEFLMRALRYLAVHPDPAGLVASLSDGFPRAPECEPKGPAATDEAPAADPAPGEEGVPAAPGGPAADEGRKGDEGP